MKRGKYNVVEVTPAGERSASGVPGKHVVKVSRVTQVHPFETYCEAATFYMDLPLDRRDNAYIQYPRAGLTFRTQCGFKPAPAPLPVDFVTAEERVGA